VKDLEPNYFELEMNSLQITVSYAVNKHNSYTYTDTYTVILSKGSLICYPNKHACCHKSEIRAMTGKTKWCYS